MRGLLRAVAIVLLLVVGTIVMRCLVLGVFLVAGHSTSRMDYRVVWDCKWNTPVPSAFRVAGFPHTSIGVHASPDGVQVDTLDWPIVAPIKDFEADWIGVPAAGGAGWIRRAEISLDPPMPYLGARVPQELVAFGNALRIASEDRSHGAAVKAARIDPGTVEVELCTQHGEQGQRYVYRVRDGVVEPRLIQPYHGPWDGVGERYMILMSSIAATLIGAIVFMVRVLVRRRGSTKTGWESFDRFGDA